MSGYDGLINIAGRRSDEALLAWRRIKSQCDEARHKLTLLKQHGERYRDLMRAGLKEGTPATAAMAYVGFIGQIEEVVVRQEGEVGRLEEACTRQWQELVEARRDRRLYEILRERNRTQKMEAALRRSQAEIDELLQRVAKLL
jgi:flagellar export protein FliJ